MIDLLHTKVLYCIALLRLRERDLLPPSDAQGRHFRYRHAETGHWSEARDYGQWLLNCRKHRRAMELPIPADFSAHVEAQLCESLPPTWCMESTEQVIDGFGVEDVGNWIKAVAHRFTSGAELVSQEEANRRARICVGCPLNVEAGGCSACKKVASYLTPGMAQRETAYDRDLKSCAICHCFLKIKTFFPLSVIHETDAPENQDLYPSFCWQKLGGENYRPE